MLTKNAKILHRAKFCSLETKIGHLNRIMEEKESFEPLTHITVIVSVLIAYHLVYFCIIPELFFMTKRGGKRRDHTMASLFV